MAADGPGFHASVNASTGVQVGDHNTQINTAVDAGTIPAARDVAAAGVDNLPARSAVFVGRDLSEVDGLLNGAGAGVVVGQAAVHGLGGVGKTELALHYAREYRDRYDLIWWITADTADNVGLGLAALTRRLHPVAVLADAQAWAVSWLQTHTGWLLLLDNVEDITHITPLLGQVEGHGQVLVTTRRDLGTARWLRHGLTPLRLDVLSRPASVQLLTRLTGSTDTDGAEKLAAELGDLPLALEQAAAYISQHARLDFSGYRLLLAEQFTRVAGDAGEGTAQRGITGIWQLTMTAITDRSPLAGRVLAVLAWLAPDTLPEDVLLPLSEDPLDVDEALALLASYNMITRAGVGVSVHRLVQAVTRDLSSGGGPDAADEAAGLLAQAIPDSPIDNVAGWPRWNALLPHVDALIANLGAGHDNTYILYVGERAATYRQEQGQLVPAITLFEQMLTDYRRMFGDDHALTLIIQHNLAAAYQSAGRLDDAITMYEQVLAVQRRVLGDDHPDTLDTAAALREVRGP